MKKITITIVLAALCLFFKASAQAPKPSPSLKVGDTLPELVVRNIVNYHDKSIRLSDFKDKLLILDFWATSCAPCIEHMPLIYAIQKKHPEQVFFLPVNIAAKFDPPGKLEAFFRERKKAFDLPSAAQDTLLRSLFQPQSLCVYVWIQNGVVRAVTGAEEVTEENVLRIARSANAKVKQVNKTTNDMYKPLFMDGNGGNQPPSYRYRSMLLPYIPGLVGISVDQDDSGRISRRYAYNMTVRVLLSLSHPEFARFPPDRVRIRSRHPEMLRTWYDTDSLKEKHLFSYEAIFPPVSRATADRYFREDIDRYLPFTLDTVSLTDTCWVLKLSKTSKLKPGDASDTRTNIEDHTGLPIYFNNYLLSLLAAHLETAFNTPVLDETGYPGNVRLQLPGNLRDSAAVASSLARQGLRLSREKRALEYLVIRDREKDN